MGGDEVSLRHRTFTRVRAVLAGALVLGVGASVTLASWSDSEYAAGTFTASTFRLESSTQAADWRDSTSATDASLTVNATGLSPGASAYSWLNIRTTPASTVGGTIVLTSSTPVGDLSDALEYRAVMKTSTSSCDATAFSGAPTYIAGSSAYLPVTAVEAPAVATPIAAAGSSPLRYCFDIRIKAGTDNSFQGKSATVTWLFTGTSN
ncbi:SipW-dependent-type signal peptide-containing protein [Arthrobacter sp. FW305-BF8]|uniref:SipW-dependent-type signal peptide-containing protein n=1 Tax=Arthrobacter sp. FW305-BF8 TaxID=2879617 RepID=UPI001F434947|nr:SipW-dependent-type signal peptide-containing protein [Arthrobacter sp. FW305-BF8]UKA53370.1 SipW-dependent-type signal peptide-containing protein [Arthrobacter sp. FW305-BF8]